MTIHLQHTLVAFVGMVLMSVGMAAEPLPGDAIVPPEWARVPAYTKRPTDPAAVERGQSLFVANGCSFCHGNDARGGNGGPNLLRTQTVLNDQKGELITKPVTQGVANTAMVGFALKENEIADIAEFLHSFDTLGSDRKRLKPASFTMGDAKAGKKYFTARCAHCHSADGDLQGIANKFDTPRTLQQRWLMPRSNKPTTVTIKFPDGQQLNGALLRMDEFVVTLKLANGEERSFDLDSGAPQIAVNSPISAHKALLPTYHDNDIHDVTAYLVTLK